MNALIGSTGFVGGTILRQGSAFDRVFHSTDIERIAGGDFDLIVCAGAPGAKWRANRDPEADRASLRRLTDSLRAVTCRRFVLISTVDVFREPVGVDEDSAVSVDGLHAYGLHRRELERFVVDSFPNTLVVRLPALVGSGLRKNALFDLHNRRTVEALPGSGRFQFYPTRRLWADLATAIAANLRLVHLVAEPVRLDEVAREAFGIALPASPGPAPAYDVGTRHAEAFGRSGRWQVTAAESLAAIRDWAATEPRTPG